jgi:hypothetical protein
VRYQILCISSPAIAVLGGSVENVVLKMFLFGVAGALAGWISNEWQSAAEKGSSS